MDSLVLHAFKLITTTSILKPVSIFCYNNITFAGWDITTRITRTARYIVGLQRQETSVWPYDTNSSTPDNHDNSILDHFSESKPALRKTQARIATTVITDHDIGLHFFN